MVERDGREFALDQFAISQAFRELAGTLYRETLWLIPDQFGAPRMIAERTGSLAGIKRRDYLPFGEEIVAGLGGRTVQQGYVADSVRQQFTGQERDDKTAFLFHLDVDNSFAVIFEVLVNQFQINILAVVAVGENYQTLFRLRQQKNERLHAHVAAAVRERILVRAEIVNFPAQAEVFILFGFDLMTNHLGDNFFR